jgi:isopenicillin-N N-acyltransferase-like protein
MPQALAVTARDRGVFAHASHCLDATVAPYEAERLPSPGSPGRCVRMQALLEEPAGKITVEDIRRMVADHASRPEPIGRHASTPAEYETASALITEPVSRTLHLSYGPPCGAKFATYRIA